MSSRMSPCSTLLGLTAIVILVAAVRASSESRSEARPEARPASRLESRFEPGQDSRPAAEAAPVTSTDRFEVDAVHSTVVFKIRHLDVSYAFGRFNDISGTYQFDPASETGGAIDIKVKTASIDTNNDTRDTHLRSADFFDVEKFPELTFKTTSIKPKDGRFTLTGELSLHGVTKTISVEAEYVGHGADPWNGYRSGFITTFTVKRSDYGMTAFAPPALGDEVEVTVSIEGIRR